MEFIKKLIAVLAGSVLLWPLAVLAVSVPPTIPLLVYGDVSLYGVTAPAGTVISVANSGATIATTTVDSAGKYFFEIPASYVGSLLTYKIGSLFAAEKVCLNPLQYASDHIDLVIAVSSPPPSGGGGGGGGVPVVIPSNISISINNGATSTNTQNVALFLAATNAIQVAISNSADFAGANWEMYVISKNWTLLSRSGTKTVYAKFRSSSGGVSNIISDSIILELSSTESGAVVPQGEVLGAVTYNFGLHSLVKTKDSPDVYAVFNNTKRKIISLEIFNSYSSYWTNQSIETISQAYLNSLTDTTLIKTPDSPNVYILAKGFKRLLASVEIFNSYGLDWSKVVTINQTEIDSYRVAPLIKHGVDLFWLDDGRVRHIFPSMESLTRNGYNIRDAIDVNDLEFGSYANGIPINN